MRHAATIGLLTAMVLGTGSAGAQTPDGALLTDYTRAVVGPPPPALGLDPFYQKATDAEGIIVVGSAQVPDLALLVARDIVNHMMAKRPDLRAAMVGQKMRVCVMAQSESTTDLPEQRDWKKPTPDDPRLTTDEREHYDERIGKLTDKQYWDRRARGMGGNPTSCAEENLLGYPGTRYFGENILVHEFAHGIMDVGIRKADPALRKEIRAAYDAAMAQGLWKGHYAATTVNEYWAEGTQTWFWSNYVFQDGAKRVMTPDDLRQYDPRLFELLGRVYPDHRIPMDVYHARELGPRSRPARPQP